jgi:serine/threonine protein kinase
MNDGDKTEPMEMVADYSDEVDEDDFPQVFGKFTLVKKLGSGGMAEILLAKAAGPSGFEKPLVIKRILKHLTNETAFTEMFLSEARIAARLHHPNVAQIYDLGRIGGRYFIAMEYIEGPTFSQLFRQCRLTGIKMPMTQVIHIVKEVALGLNHAHAATDNNGQLLNLVHRDVSPSNIMITKDGVVKLVDFGVATASIQLHKTQAGALKGKYGYMAPEQCEGQAVDNRTDIFSLGVVLYEFTTGTRLFSSKNPMDTLRRILRGAIPEPKTLVPDYPQILRDIIYKMLAANPRDRYQSAMEVHMALASYLDVVGGAMTNLELARLIRSVSNHGQVDAPDNRDRSALTDLSESIRSAADEPSIGIASDSALDDEEEDFLDLSDAINLVTLDEFAEPESSTAAVQNGPQYIFPLLLLGVLITSAVAWVLILA